MRQSDLTAQVIKALGPRGVHAELRPLVSSLEPPHGSQVEVRARCPFHDDHNPSWCWNLEKGVARCLACDEGNRSLIGYLAEETNRSYVQVLDDLCQKLGLARPQKRLLTVADYAKHKMLPESFLKTRFQLSDGPEGMLIPYLDKDGACLATRRRKYISQSPKWPKGTKANQMVYGLHEWGRLASTKQLYVCEGESDLHTAWSYGLPAIALPGAATNPQRIAELILDLAPEQIFLLADNDDAGWRMTKNLAQRLALLGCIASVRKVTLPTNDLSDLHCESANTFRQVVALATERAEAVQDAIIEHERCVDAHDSAFGQAVRNILKLPGLLPSDRLTLMGFAEMARDDLNRPVSAPKNKIAKAAGFTRKTIQNRVPGLVEAGLLVRCGDGLRLGSQIVNTIP